MKGELRELADSIARVRCFSRTGGTPDEAKRLRVYGSLFLLAGAADSRW